MSEKELYGEVSAVAELLSPEHRERYAMLVLHLAEAGGMWGSTVRRWARDAGYLRIDPDVLCDSRYTRSGDEGWPILCHRPRNHRGRHWYRSETFGLEWR